MGQGGTSSLLVTVLVSLAWLEAEEISLVDWPRVREEAGRVLERCATRELLLCEGEPGGMCSCSTDCQVMASCHSCCPCTELQEVASCCLDYRREDTRSLGRSSTCLPIRNSWCKTSYFYMVGTGQMSARIMSCSSQVASCPARYGNGDIATKCLKQPMKGEDYTYHIDLPVQGASGTM